MEEKNSQENAFDTIEPIKPTETAIDINGPSSEIKDDILSRTNNSLSSETKSDILSRTKKHRENIDRIIVPQYIDDQYVTDNNYIVTYSNKIDDNSILGWTINIEEDGQQQPDVYFKLDKDYYRYSFVLYKKTLMFYYRDDNRNCKYLF